MEENPTPDPDHEWEAAWREMSMEEQDESLERLLAVLKERRAEIKAKYPEKDVEGMITDLAGRLEEQRRHTERCRETEEAWLQAVANEAEAEANLTVMLAEVMKGVENLTEEQWDALPVDIRMEMMNRLQEWERDKERFLSQLPIEQRRKLEE